MKKIIAALITVAGLATTAALADDQPITAAAPSSTTQIEFIGVNDVSAARDYVPWVQAIAKKYGVEINAYQVTETKKGTAYEAPTFAWVIRFEDPADLKKIGADPEYRSNIEHRDKIFDFSARTVHWTKKIN